MASELNNEPTYNLKAVVKETGIKPDTLRAWERRYGLPQPERTKGGHRIFTQRDIETLKWLTARQDEGLSISRAVALWRKIEAENQDPLLSMSYDTSSTPGPVVVLSGKAIEEARQLWLEACMGFDEARAEQILNQAFAHFSPETVILELMTKGLSEIGEGWYRGEITVQQEHFASALALRRIDTLIAALPAPTKKGTIMVGCAPEDEHTFSPLVITYLLRRRGRQALFMGANVPFIRFSELLDRTQPVLVIMTAQDLHSTAQLLPFADLLARRGIPFALGGLVFNNRPNLHNRVPGHLLGENLADTPEAVERLLAAGPEPPTRKPLPESYLQALETFERREAQVMAALSDALVELNMDSNYLDTANLHIRRDILASLRLGELEYMSNDIIWAQGLIENYGVPPEALTHYLRTYAEIIRGTLGQAGEPVAETLQSLSADLAGGS